MRFSHRPALLSISHTSSASALMGRRSAAVTENFLSMDTIRSLSSVSATVRWGMMLSNCLRRVGIRETR